MIKYSNTKRFKVIVKNNKLLTHDWVHPNYL